MKTLFALLLLAPLATPVAADIAYPNTAGADYCSMRRNGVSHDSALDAAIRDNWENDYDAPMITMQDGSKVAKDTYEMADYINVMCPDYFGN